MLQLMTPDPGNPGNQGIVPNHRFYRAKVFLREFCFNYRHPDPRRVLQGGPVLGLMTPDPGNNRNQRIVPNHRFTLTKPCVIVKKLSRIAVFGPGASQGGLGCSGGHFGRVWRSFGRVLGSFVFGPRASQGGLGCSGEHSGGVWRSFGRACVAGGSRASRWSGVLWGTLWEGLEELWESSGKLYI